MPVTSRLRNYQNGLSITVAFDVLVGVSDAWLIQFKRHPVVYPNRWEVRALKAEKVEKNGEKDYGK